MPLLLGQAIDGCEVENETSAWSGERFPRFCDNLVWAVSRQVRTALPSFSVNTNAPDGGVDAECVVEIPAPLPGHESPLMAGGWNVFQYKKRGIKFAKVLLPAPLGPTMATTSPASTSKWTFLSKGCASS